MFWFLSPPGTQKLEKFWQQNKKSSKKLLDIDEISAQRSSCVSCFFEYIPQISFTYCLPVWKMSVCVYIFKLSEHWKVNAVHVNARLILKMVLKLYSELPFPSKFPSSPMPRQAMVCSVHPVSESIEHKPMTHGSIITHGLRIFP